MDGRFPGVFNGSAMTASVIKPILHKYIINEIWPVFLASLFVSLFIVLTTKMLSIMELIVDRGVHPGRAVGMILCLLPDILMFTLPAAALIAVVVAFLRLSSDSEIIALESSGVSLYQMLPPVIILSITGLAIGLAVSIVAVPWGNRSFKDLLFRIAETKADLGLRERVFSSPFHDVYFFVNGFSSSDRTMKDVFVVDGRDPKVTHTIVAEEGRIFTHPRERSITLQFRKGTILVVESGLKSVRTIDFDTYHLNVGLRDIMAALSSRRRDPKEMSFGELRRNIGLLPASDTRRNRMMIDLVQMFSIPVAVFFMGIIGAPLGSQMKSRGRSEGIGVSLVVFLCYYMCLSGMRSVCETGVISPAVGMWIPDLFLAGCAVYLLRLSVRERSLRLLSRLFQVKDLMDAWAYMLKHRRKEPGPVRAEKEDVRVPAAAEQLVFPLKIAAEAASPHVRTAAYVGNIRARRFHRMDCKWAGRISVDNLLPFDSREAALREGYAPCKVCRP